MKRKPHIDPEQKAYMVKQANDAVQRIREAIKVATPQPTYFIPTSLSHLPRPIITKTKTVAHSEFPEVKILFTKDKELTRTVAGKQFKYSFTGPILKTVYQK